MAYHGGSALRLLALLSCSTPALFLALIALYGRLPRAWSALAQPLLALYPVRCAAGRAGGLGAAGGELQARREQRACPAPPAALPKLDLNTPRPAVPTPGRSWR